MKVTKFVSAYVELTVLDENGQEVVVRMRYDDAHEPSVESTGTFTQDRHIRDVEDPEARWMSSRATGLQDVTLALKNVRLGEPVPREPAPA